MTEIIKIQKEHIVNGKSINEIAREEGRSWETVNSAVNCSSEAIKKRGRRPNKISIVGNSQVIEKIKFYLNFEIQHEIKRKQRFTTNFLYKKFVDENIFSGCDRYFRKIMRKERKSFDVEKHKPKTYLELEFPLGEFLQLDHGEVEIQYLGHIKNGYIFTASVPGYCLRYCQLYLSKGSESWGDFHEKTFIFFGGIFKFCMYDNDTVLKSGEIKTPYFTEISGHYRFNAIFCNKASGWEKGSVENAVGFCRRNYMAGRPEFSDLLEFNKYLENMCTLEIQKESNGEPLQDYFLRNKNLLNPIKAPWEWGTMTVARVSSMQYIQHCKSFYSVPEKYVGQTVNVYTTPFYVKIAFDGEYIASHIRSFIENQSITELDHYLEQLERKPKAIPFSKAMKQDFPEYLNILRKKLANRFEDGKGDLEFIGILKLRRTCPENIFKASIEKALANGGITRNNINALIILMKPFEEKIEPGLCKYFNNQFNVDISNDFNLKNYSHLCSVEDNEVSNMN